MVQSIDRAMQIAALLSSDEKKLEWSISELSSKTGLAISTMHRLLHSLMEHELVAQNPETKRYRIGYRWMELGLRVLHTLDVRTVARPALEQLARDVEENAYLNIASGSDGIVIEKVDSPLKVRVDENLGMRVPLTVGAPNKVLLAYMKAGEQQTILSRVPEERREILQLQLQHIRENGYAISLSEKTENTAAVAAPIFNYAGLVKYAVSIGIPGFRFTEERIPELVRKVRETSAHISYCLGQA